MTHAPETRHQLLSKQVDTRRTIMLRNLPSSFTRAALFEILEDTFFSGRFDFVYVATAFASWACLGYAPPEINITSNFDGVRIFVVPQTIDLLETIHS